MHRATPLTGRLADLAGRVAGVLLRSTTVRSFPGAAGAAAVSIGLGQIYHPLLLVAAGGFLLLLDRRT